MNHSSDGMGPIAVGGSFGADWEVVVDDWY